MPSIELPGAASRRVAQARQRGGGGVSGEAPYHPLLRVHVGLQAMLAEFGPSEIENLQFRG